MSLRVSMRSVLKRWRLQLLLAVLAAGWPGCGTDVIIVANFGTVVSDADCVDGGGQFPLRQQQGLVVVVILDENSTILRPDGAAGRCSDLKAGREVSVSGSEQGSGILAGTVQLRSGT